MTGARQGMVLCLNRKLHMNLNIPCEIATVFDSQKRPLGEGAFVTVFSYSGERLRSAPQSSRYPYFVPLRRYGSC